MGGHHGNAFEQLWHLIPSNSLFIKKFPSRSMDLSPLLFFIFNSCEQNSNL